MVGYRFLSATFHRRILYIHYILITSEEFISLYFKHQTDMTRKERIEQMESLFDQSNEVLQRLREAVDDFFALQPIISKLENYYNTAWRTDFEADEKGKLPADLKRGVLSEDGLWDLLEEYQRLKESMEDETV